jgi:hypothetical protein
VFCTLAHAFNDGMMNKRKKSKCFEGGKIKESFGYYFCAYGFGKGVTQTR